MSPKKPNIILINCDDLGYGDLGCYGSAKNRTPYIDSLAAGGMRLTDFYMASPVCSASRAAMMTGCYPTRVGFGDRPVLFPASPYGLSNEETTIAKALKSGGYSTKIIGKWHCGDQPEFLPTRHGFDEYFGIPYSNDMGQQPQWDGREALGDPSRPPLPLLRNEIVIQEQPDQRGITERYTDEALQFIHANQEQPFFLYLAHMYVHVPLFVPKQFLENSENGAYGGAVECIDWSTGVLIDRLKKLGLFENTLIIFTSDNGSRARDEGGSNAPCRGTKATTWEGGQRVPAILHWPENIPAGTTSSEVTRSIDFLPTLLQLSETEAPLPNVIDGVDLSGLLLGQTQQSPNNTMVYYKGAELEAVRVGDWKLHFLKGTEALSALYNLKDDVGESLNLAESHGEKVKELEIFADTVRADLGDYARRIDGAGCRPVGKVDHPKPLTIYDESHPYMIAYYDLPDMPTVSG
jgi:arylsulfatase A-like enzyme